MNSRSAHLTLLACLILVSRSREVLGQCVEPIETARFMSLQPVGQNAQYGVALATDGVLLAVGAPGSSSAQGATGAVFVSALCDGVPSLEQVLVGSGTQGGDSFGHSVAISGNTIAVGSPYYGNNDRGAVFVFVRAGAGWRQQAILEASNARDFDHFGWSVTLSGDWLMVGAPEQDRQPNGIYDSGAVYFFHRNGGIWTERKIEQISTSSAAFGGAVACSANDLLIGARRIRRAFRYELRQGSWVAAGEFVAPDDEVAIDFGGSVAVDEDWAVIGAESARITPSVEVGRTYIYQRVSGEWQLSHVFQGVSGNLFGRAVSIDYPFVGVGAGTGNQRGTAYVAHHSDGAWSISEVDYGSQSAQAEFGSSLAVKSRTLFVGAPEAETPLGYDSGRCVQYELMRSGPRIVREPDDTTACIGSTVLFQVDAVAVGAALYKWRRNGQDLQDGVSGSGSAYSGTASPTLVITNIQAADAGAFQCVVTDDCGSVVSLAAGLTVCSTTADLQCDGAVDIADLTALLSHFGETGAAIIGDIDGDGEVNLADLTTLLAQFGETCPL